MPENFDRELSGGTAGRESFSGPPDLQIHVEPGVADSLGWVELDRLLTLRPGVPLRDVPDRVTFSFPEDAPTWIVKRTRGDLRREAWFDRLHGSRGRSPGAREFENLQGLSEAGIPVPRPLAWASRSDVSLVVMERVSHESDLREVLARGGEPPFAAGSPHSWTWSFACTEPAGTTGISISSTSFPRPGSGSAGRRSA